jgi:thymidylate synthase
MIDIAGRNVNTIYPEALWKMKVLGQQFNSRNGKVLRIPGPVATTYRSPKERMLLDPRRDANPFFHIFEGVWMLAGRNDTGWIMAFNTNITQFSDDGFTLHGAYGHRWRNHYGHDQLAWLITHLRHDPTSRRAVLQMFAPEVDQGWVSGPTPKDIPCNTAVYFELVNGYLNMTVTNRSNDIIWGAYGANVVHMSMLQEYVADSLGVDVGSYTQFSNNFHMYERHFDLLEGIEEPPYYSDEMVNTHCPIVRFGNAQSDLEEIEQWIGTPDYGDYTNPYILLVLRPMLTAYRFYKNKRKIQALEACNDIADLEVRTACKQWLERRKWDNAYELQD